MASPIKGSLTLSIVCRKLGIVQSKAYRIGIQMGIPFDKMQEYQSGDVLSSVINYWLSGNIAGASITWKFLAEVLMSPYVDESGLANTIITEYCWQQVEESTSNITCDYPTTSSPGLLKHSFGRISAHFADLIDKFAFKLSAANVDVKIFRSFIAKTFIPGQNISKATTIQEVFDMLVENRVWNCLFFAPFEPIFARFGGNDPELKSLLDDYKAELAGYKATTKIINFIKECTIEDRSADSEESICQYKARYNNDYCEELTAKLDEKVTEKSLVYIDEFWRSVADLFRIPPLAALLERIRKGCIEITWLISKQSATKVKSAMHSVLVFQEAKIAGITLNGDVLYRAEKNTVQELCDTVQSQDVMITQLQNELLMTKIELVQAKKITSPFKELSPSSCFKVTWKDGPDSPFAMAGPVQAVLIQGNVFVGGGSTTMGSHYDRIVMKYDIHSEEWETLPEHIASHFGMTAFKDQLVLVGGKQEGNVISNLLGVWTESTAWTCPFPPMSTARYGCSAIASYDKWLVAAGGCNEYFDAISSIEILCTITKQWHDVAVSTPVPWVDMRTAIIHDTCYFMGGLVDGLPTTSVHAVSLQALFRSKSGQTEIWTELNPLTNTSSSPFSFNGSLFAAGGVDEDEEETVTSIHLYLSSQNTWIKIGDLPSPCYDCACSTISNGKLFTAGGSFHYNAPYLKTYIADLTTLG